jgi:serine/threonine-protein kinase
VKEPSSVEWPSAPETLCGRYQVGKPLGRGGMGEVRAGWDPRLNRDVAIKLLRPDVAVQLAVRERFEAEARAAALLVHPHVVAVFDSGEEAGIPFLVMERLPGRTLADAIAEGPLDPAAVRSVGIQVLDALTAAHTAGLMHRDIKPANVLEAGPGNWKVGDFGIAKSIEAVDPGLTSTGLIVGTPAYLSPERRAGGPATAQSDMYAVAVLLYESLTGARRDDEGALLAVYPLPRPPLDDVRPGLPADLVAAINRAMDPDPAARFGSALEMAGELRGDAPPAPTVPTGTAMPTEAAPTEAFEAPPADPTQFLEQPTSGQALAKAVAWSLHRRRALGAVAAASLLVIIVVILASSSGGRQGPSTVPSPSTPPPTATSSAGLPPALSTALEQLDNAVKP